MKRMLVFIESSSCRKLVIDRYLVWLEHIPYNEIRNAEDYNDD